MDLSFKMQALLTRIKEEKYVRLWDYHRSAVDALVRRGLVTILKRRHKGTDVGPIIRLRKGNEEQNAHL